MKHIPPLKVLGKPIMVPQPNFALQSEDGTNYAVCWTREAATLFAAAPTMLDALLDLRDMSHSGSEAMAIIDEACKAAGVESWKPGGGR